MPDLWEPRWSGLVNSAKDAGSARQIAILGSMGATKRGILLIFQVVGMIITFMGTVAGVGIGLFTCKIVDRMDFHLDAKVYLIDHLPISVQPHFL